MLKLTPLPVRPAKPWKDVVSLKNVNTMNILLLRVHVTVANLKSSVRKPNPVEPSNAISDKMIWILCSSKPAALNLKRISEPASTWWKEHLHKPHAMDTSAHAGEDCGEFKFRNTWLLRSKTLRFYWKMSKSLRLHWRYRWRQRLVTRQVVQGPAAAAIYLTRHGAMLLNFVALWWNPSPYHPTEIIGWAAIKSTSENKKYSS